MGTNNDLFYSELAVLLLRQANDFVQNNYALGNQGSFGFNQRRSRVFSSSSHQNSFSTAAVSDFYLFLHKF